MEASKGAAVAGEGKAVTSIRPREGEKAAARLEALIREPAKRFSGSREARRLALLIAMFSTVHAGGEQGWKSDHLEPFSFDTGILACVSSFACIPSLSNPKLPIQLDFQGASV
jgi:hypothetical protein